LKAPDPEQVEAEPPSHLVAGKRPGERCNRQERDQASPAAANGDEQEQVDGGGEDDEDQPGDHSAAAAFGWAIQPPPRHSSPSYRTAPWPGAGAQTGSAVSTTRPSAPSRVTEHATSGARWRSRTRASNRSAGGSPATKWRLPTVNHDWAISSRAPITSVFEAGRTSPT